MYENDTLVIKLNAKELILAKVNAGNKLAKMYLFLITLGYNINDIVSFMTSPIVSFIDSITDTNIFNNYDLSIKDAIKIASGNYSPLLNNTEYYNELENGDIENFMKNHTKLDDKTKDLITLIGSIKSILNYDVKDENIIKDITEFKNVFEGANEFSSLGQILGINQGIPTSKQDLISRISKILKIYNKRFEDLGGKAPEILDFRKFIIDPEYAKKIKDSYNSVKKCVNMFDLIDHIPQFKNAFKLFAAVCDIDHNLSIKTLIFDYAYNRLIIDNPYITDTYSKNLLRSIDNIFISTFLNLLNINIPYNKGTILLNENRSSVKTVEDGVLTLDSLSNIASFKYIFENQIIPNLMSGIYYDYDKWGNVIKIEDISLISNSFIKSLILGYDRDIPLYKCNLNMMTIENSNDSKIRFQKYIKGLKELKNIKINGVSLANLFVLYNLIVNKNQYGADRLTTLFESFILSEESLSIIKNYLNFIGKLDYNSEVSGEGNIITIKYNNKEIEVSISDLKRQAATIVKSLSKQNDPCVIINEESGPVIYERDGRSYIPVGSVIPTVTGETLNQTLERIYNNTAYFTLGGNYKSDIDNILKDIAIISSNTINIIKDLQERSILKIQKLCE